jgi:hypothetical protein
MIGGFIGKAIGEPVGIVTTAAAFETNVHSVATFKPARINVLLALRQHPAFEPPETNVHFLAKFTPAKYSILQSLRQNSDTLGFQPVAETNPHFLATFKPTKVTVLRSLRENPDIEPISAAETNVHFIAKFTPVRYTFGFRFNFEGCDDSVPPPPGAGKRRDFPSYIPQPPRDAKPNKPFQPVWDKRRQEEQERARALAELPSAPIPLPPAALFERQSDAQALGLPELDHGLHPEQLEPGLRDAQDLSDLAGALQAFAQRAAPAPDTMSQPPASHDAEERDIAPSRPRIVVPPAHDLGQRMRDAKDLSDAMALMRAMGLVE